MNKKGVFKNEKCKHR